MKRRTWGIAAAVVVLAVAGTTTALLVAGSGEASDYKALPTCDKLATVLPGRPALAVQDQNTRQPLERGLDPAFMDIQCATTDLQTYIAVDIYQAGSMDLATAMQYADKAVHDSQSRAKTEFDRRSNGLKQLNADVRYSAGVSGKTMCNVYSLKRNAVVVLDIAVAQADAASPGQFEAACRKIAGDQMSKLVGAALG